MKKATLRRCGILLACILASAPLVGGQPGSGPKLATSDFKGKVVPLSRLLVKAGVELDADASPHWLALATDDGKIYPLVKDAGARMFFKDPALLNRPMRLTGRLAGNTSLLQVVNVHSYRQGKLHEVYYWCDICSIRAYESGKCGCCGAPMELREVPVK